MRRLGGAWVLGVAAIGSVPFVGLGRSASGADGGPAVDGAAASAKPATSASVAEEVWGPANNVVGEVSVGYAAGPFSAIEGHNPAVAAGPMFHLGLGYAWPLKFNQSVGIMAIADGTLDSDRTTNMGGHVAGRFGGAAFVYGERAHLRLLFGYSHAALDGATYGGIGVGFGAGWHVPLGDKGKWKRAAFIAELAPSWDFLGAGSETLHRWNFGLLFGIAVI